MTNDAKKLDFISQLFDVNGDNPYEIRIVDHKPFSMDEQMMIMLDRFMEDKTVVFPFPKSGMIHWLICNKDRHRLHRDYKEIYSFIKVFCTDDICFRHFNPEYRIGKLGKDLFTDGYFLLKSVNQEADNIWKMLGLWMQLDERRPADQLEKTERSAFALRSEFQQYLALENWIEAERTLEEIRQGYYVSDENYIFLRIQFWTHQRKWEKIWYSKDFELIAAMETIPLQIRCSLLSAFYYVILAPAEIEERYEEAYQKFQQHRFRLGNLLYTSLGLDEEIYLRIFAHEAFLNGDRNRLENLMQKANDLTTKELLQYFVSQISVDSIEAEIKVEPELEGEELALYYIKEKRYDDAYNSLKDCSPTPKVAELLCRLAVVTEAKQVYSSAYEVYKQLSEDEQVELEQNPDSKPQVMLVKQWKEGLKSQVEQPTNETWNYWFQSFLSGELSEDKLGERLKRIDELNSAFDWSPSMLTDLTEVLTSIAIEELTPSKRILLEKALPFFVSDFLLQHQFPNPQAQDVYDYTVELMKIHSKRNRNNTELLLKLMEGMLLLEVTLVNNLWNSAKYWFNINPTKALLSQVLVALELFEEYGLSHDELRALWGRWTGSIGEGIRTIYHTDLVSWWEFGRIISGDEYLLHMIEEAIKTMSTDEETDVISQQDSLIVTIFTLRPQTAKRAIERLQLRNEKIKYRICADETLTDQAKIYAKSSDINIVVTTCLTHALFYGIQRYLNKTVYPKSSGTTGIINAFEDYLQNNY
ncbi:hypothetical protein SAMN06265361_10883 [Laceyella tengchongensis]|jgi:hypothetical protein|uniref:Uncharacterized protein n=1 Tax=Laceyella tengchongensis TaxID=574699 RepID=A0AA45WRR4_9BACL|nr:protein DpdD [Laceyella tengchongensis]SMP32037.1 hypothetical protein SAMN06265361_10883 [Laceyella tengchongensis]